jgi:hypothetical protein
MKESRALVLTTVIFVPVFGTSAAGSRGCCNEELVERLGGSLPVEGHPGAAVEFGGDLVEGGLGPGAEVGGGAGKY